MILIEEFALKLLPIVQNPGVFLLVFSLFSLYFHDMRRKPYFFIAIFVSLFLLVIDYLGGLSLISAKLYGKSFLLFTPSRFSFALSFIFLVAYLCIVLFSYPTREFNKFFTFSGMICGASLIAVNANDYISFFFGFELLSIISIFLIFIDPGEKSYFIGFRYAVIHIFSGILLLIGIIIQAKYSNDTAISQLIIPNLIFGDYVVDIILVGKICILLALLIDCGVPPFSNWLVDTYSNIHPYSAALLSSFGTKVAIFAMLKIFAANETIIQIAIFTMIYSGVLALATGNMRQILSYSIINKIGLILIAIGVGSELAKFAAVLLIISHVLYNLILFQVVGKLNLSLGVKALNEVLTYDRRIWLFLLIGVCSALSLPLTGTYVSKVIFFSALEDNSYMYVASLMLVIPSMVAICKLLLPYFRMNDLIKIDLGDWRFGEVLSLVILSALTIFLGLTFAVKYYASEVIYLYSFEHVTKIIIELITILFTIYFCRKYLVRGNIIILDFDWLFRGFFYKIFSYGEDLVHASMKKIFPSGESYVSFSRLEFINRNISPVWRIGLVLNLFVVSIILLFLLIYL